jgi:hypothetical protein
MSYERFDPMENPPYDGLFAEAAKNFWAQDGSQQSGRVFHLNQGLPYFWGLRYTEGFNITANLLAYEKVMQRLAVQDSDLCQQIMIEQLPTVGLKTTARVAAQNGIQLDLDAVFKVLPSWITRLRRRDMGQDSDRKRILDIECWRGLQTGGMNVFDSLLTELIFGADSHPKKTVIKRYLSLMQLMPADIQALRLHKRYTPKIEKLWSECTVKSQAGDFFSHLVCMTMKGTLDFAELEAAAADPGFRCEGIDLIRLLGNQPPRDLDVESIVSMLSSDRLSTDSMRLMVFETALRSHMQRLDQTSAEIVSQRLASSFLKSFPLKDPVWEPYEPMHKIELNIDGLTIVARTIAQAAYQGATTGLVMLADHANKCVEQQGFDRKKFMRTLKTGIFNVGACAYEDQLKANINDTLKKRLFDLGMTQSAYQYSSEQTESQRFNFPRLDVSTVPENLRRPMGDIVCNIITCRFKEGDNMTRRVMQQMVDMDVLTGAHIRTIADDDRAANALLKATLPKQLVEASESLMARKLEADLGL